MSELIDMPVVTVEQVTRFRNAALRIESELAATKQKLVTAQTEIECLAASCKSVTGKLEAAELLIQTARGFDASPDDAEFEFPHPVFMMAQDNDNLVAENADLREKLESAEQRIKESQEQEPVGYVERSQFERWDNLRGTEFESAERCYMPFSRTPFESDLSVCDFPLYAIPLIPNTDKELK